MLIKADNIILNKNKKVDSLEVERETNEENLIEIINCPPKNSIDFLCF